jgi:hypothetical protein
MSLLDPPLTVQIRNINWRSIAFWVTLYAVWFLWPTEG